jgi:uncharacterized protein (DUF433 family)
MVLPRLAVAMTPLTEAQAAPRQALGRAFYGLGDLRAYLALSGSRDDADRALPWLTTVLNPIPHKPRRPDYSFSDLISLFVVRLLLQKGVTPKTIRDAERYLRKQLQTDRPFVSEEIKTDGRNVFYRDDVIPGQIEAADMRGQQTMREAVKDRLTSVRYTDGTAAYWTPLENVMLDPRVQFGEPVIAGTRLPTETVAAAVRHFGPAGAAERFAISPEAVSSAVAFERKLAAVS